MVGCGRLLHRFGGFYDLDNDGWPDILTVNGHVYPEVGQPNDEQGYRQRKVLYHNLGNGRFADVSQDAGPGILEPASARGLHPCVSHRG